MLLSRLYRSCICSRAASCNSVSLYNVHYECLLVHFAQCHICPTSEASRWSQSAMKKCFVIILYIYIKKSIFCNVCGVVLLKSVSSVRLCVCFVGRVWESGCAEVNKPLCGSSYPVHSLVGGTQQWIRRATVDSAHTWILYLISYAII